MVLCKVTFCILQLHVIRYLSMYVWSCSLMCSRDDDNDAGETKPGEDGDILTGFSTYYYRTKN